MSDDTRDVSQLRVQLKDYILDSEAEIRSNLKLGLWRGQNDPIVVKMQKVVDDLIARVREDDEDKFLWKYSAAEQRGYNAGERAGYAAALRDAVEAVVNCDDYHSAANMLLVDAYREGLQAAREAIEVLGSER